LVILFRGSSLVPIAGDEIEAAKLAEEGLHGATNIAMHELTFNEAANLAFKIEGCGCFPGATDVLTPHGRVAIASLHIGDKVLAENPVTGKVEPKQVLAVIDDGVKPLMQVQLSDGGYLSVTANHPFYVDSGPGIEGPAWVQAGSLHYGDRIRTENGQDVSVVGLRYHVGRAHVYTLTVATDHDFFVGGSGVLVHNSFCSLTEAEVQQALQAIGPNDLHHIFSKAQHGFGPLVAQLGSQQAVIEAVIRGIDKTQLPTGGFYTQVINVAGNLVQVNGHIVNGVLRIGTAYIP
jgi:Pretoxin HINT domain